MIVHEVNFDGIIGPTHHYGGLAAGNLASQKNRRRVSRPREAALQGLAKMKRLLDLGLKQAVFPPLLRPNFALLRSHGLTGTDQEIIATAAVERSDLLSIAYNAASMWAANAATVSPSRDTADGRVHITPANLISTPHRAQDAEETAVMLRAIFPDRSRFIIDDPLPRHRLLADEGAANQMRLCPSHSDPGVEVFVYGRDGENLDAPTPRKYFARQSLQASERVAALHKLPKARQIFVQQNPDAIDAGVFHNDVIAVANENLLICHEQAFVNQRAALQKIRAAMIGEVIVEVTSAELTLAEAVQTYLFNSQILTLPEGGMLLLCPAECEHHPRARAVIARILASANPVTRVEYIDVSQSMRNGGGPACLRLRVPLTEVELSSLGGNVLLSESLYDQLCDWVRRHYREELAVTDLADPHLIDEVRDALTELSSLLQLPVF